MLAEFISPQDPRWSLLLARASHDVYHRPEYVDFAARQEGGTPTAFYAEADGAAFLAPLLIRDIPSDLSPSDIWKDAVGPYGYPSPILVPDNDARALTDFLEAFRQVGKEWHIVTAFFRMHPLLPLPAPVLAEHGELIEHGQTVSIDLSVSLDESWSQIRENHRRNIKKLKRAGYQAHMDRWELYGEFIAIYSETMERRDASDFYFFGESYFEELRASLGDHVHLCTVCTPTGTLAAAGLFTEIGGIVQYHLGGTRGEFLSAAPSKLMFDHVRRWAKQAGNRVLHLGGGVGGYKDSLFEFKAGFSKVKHPFCTYRMILDDDQYASLTRRWEECYGPSGNDSDFFPSYRRPGPYTDCDHDPLGRNPGPSSRPPAQGYVAR
jgi:hypothetical protein